MLSRETQQRLRRFARQLRNASQVAQALAATRRQGAVGRVVALAALARLGLELALPPDHDVTESMAASGWQIVDTGLAAWICRLLQGSELPRTRRAEEDYSLVIWEGGVSAVYERGAYHSGPYVRDDADLGAVLRAAVWRPSVDLLLTASSHASRSEDRFRLHPLSDPPPYYGSPGLPHYARRVRAYEGHEGAGGRGRCFLICGPTGVGKGVLARNLAGELAMGARTLKIDYSEVSAMSMSDLTGFIRWLRPAILLLDDVDISCWDNSHLLGPLEAMRQHDGMVFLTLMDDGDGLRRRPRDSSYLSGMRPGRVDEVWQLKRPDPRVREKLLRHYLGRSGQRVVGDRLDKVVEATKGLTGAYIAEVALRLRVHGMRRWRTEVNAVKRQAPPVRRGTRRMARKRKR